MVIQSVRLTRQAGRRVDVLAKVECLCHQKVAKLNNKTKGNRVKVARRKAASPGKGKKETQGEKQRREERERESGHSIDYSKAVYAQSGLFLASWNRYVLAVCLYCERRSCTRSSFAPLSSFSESATALALRLRLERGSS